MRAPSAGRLGEGRRSCPAAWVPSTALLVPAGSPCARTTPSRRCEPALSALSKASSPQPQEKATKDAPPPPQTHAVPLPHPLAATRPPLRSPCCHLPPCVFGHGPLAPEPPVPLCPFAGPCQAGQGRRPSEGGSRPTIWREALLGAVCVRTCVRVLRRVRVSEARAQGSSGQGRAGQSVERQDRRRSRMLCAN